LHRERVRGPCPGVERASGTYRPSNAPQCNRGRWGVWPGVSIAADWADDADWGDDPASARPGPDPALRNRIPRRSRSRAEEARPPRERPPEEGRSTGRALVEGAPADALRPLGSQAVKVRASWSALSSAKLVHRGAAGKVPASEPIDIYEVIRQRYERGSMISRCCRSPDRAARSRARSRSRLPSNTSTRLPDPVSCVVPPGFPST